MISIGARELRQNASRYLRLVQAGETVQVTDRGRPVAHLVPPPAGGAYERLLASGRLRPGDGGRDYLDEPLPPRAGEPTLSDALARLREDER